MNNKKVIKKPKEPLIRIIRNDSFYPACNLCHSTLQRKWSWKKFKYIELGCIQPQCENYYKNKED